jgi:decaprenylphospho-beta-D-ribofuranose 2-oxidase
MNAMTQLLSGWGGVPTKSCRVAHLTDRAAATGIVNGVFSANGLVQANLPGSGLIGRGLGRAYGDSALPADGVVVDCTGLDQFIAFDRQSGLLECEAGVSFADIISVFLPQGWFLPTTPGTKFVTVGGAIAADVHGKNHHRVSSFGAFVEWIELMLGDATIVRCSRTNDPDLFFATLGGMGLTGLILSAAFRLVRVETASLRVRYRKTTDLASTLAAFDEGDSECEHSVAWIDCMAGGAALGRSVVMQGSPATRAEIGPRGDPFRLPFKRVKAVPFTPPISLLSPLTVRAFNSAFYNLHADSVKVVDIDTFFYPLDAVRHWNRLYGPTGFVQYQAFFPRSTSADGLPRLLEAVVQSGAASFLAVLKSCGAADGGLLSYLEPGHTLALDIPYHPRATPDLCHQLDRILLDYGGRLYLAKDSLMSAATFRAMYPRADEFLVVKGRVDPTGRFVSAQSRRLGLAL